LWGRPGDPKLITVRGLELIRRADSIIYDYLANDALLASAASGRGAYLMWGSRRSRHEMPQRGINALIRGEGTRKRHRGAP